MSAGEPSKFGRQSSCTKFVLQTDENPKSLSQTFDSKLLAPKFHLQIRLRAFSMRSGDQAEQTPCCLNYKNRKLIKNIIRSEYSDSEFQNVRRSHRKQWTGKLVEEFDFKNCFVRLSNLGTQGLVETFHWKALEKSKQEISDLNSSEFRVGLPSNPLPAVQLTSGLLKWPKVTVNKIEPKRVMFMVTHRPFPFLNCN